MKHFEVQPSTINGITGWWYVITAEGSPAPLVNLMFQNPDTAQAVADVLETVWTAGVASTVQEAAITALRRNAYAEGWRDARQSGATDRGRSEAAFRELEHGHPSSTPDPGTPGRRP